MTEFVQLLESIPLPLALGAVSLMGSLGVLAFTLRWSWKSLRHLEAERERRLARVEAEVQRVAELEEQASRSWQGYRKFQVVKRIEEDSHSNVATFELAPFRLSEEDMGASRRTGSMMIFPPLKDLPTFKPGQYIQLRVDLPGQANLISRCYSLSRAYDAKKYSITVARVPSAVDPLTGRTYPPGVVSTYLLDSLHERAVIDVTVPQGDFWLETQSSDPVVLVGWGIHAVPLLCIFETIARSGGSRKAWLFLEVGHEEDLIKLLDPLIELAEKDPSGRLRIWLSFGRWDSDSGMGRISRRVPRISSDLAESLNPDTDDNVTRREGRQAVAWIKRKVPEYFGTVASFYVSGPALLLRESKHDLEAWGVSPDRVHFEVFDRESLDAISEVESTGPSKVTFDVAGKTLDWDPDHRNLLGLAASAKIRIPSTCKIGKCGECEVSLVSGQVRYTKDPDWKLKPGHCLPCVATPASSTLVLGA